MTGIMCFYITRNYQVYKIPVPNGKVYKPVPSLADEEVLFTLLFYETIDRSPSKLIMANFDRLQLNSSGGYELTVDEIKKRYYNFENYGLDYDDLISEDDCIQIPKATILPTTNEKKALFDYIKEKYPSLWNNFSRILEDYIQSCILKDLELRKLVKKASTIRRKASKNQLST